MTYILYIILFHLMTGVRRSGENGATSRHRDQAIPVDDEDHAGKKIWPYTMKAKHGT